MSRNVNADLQDRIQNSDPTRKMNTPSMSNLSVILGVIILIVFAVIFIFFI